MHATTTRSSMTTVFACYPKGGSWPYLTSSLRQNIDKQYTIDSLPLMVLSLPPIVCTNPTPANHISSPLLLALGNTFWALLNPTNHYHWSTWRVGRYTKAEVAHAFDGEDGVCPSIGSILRQLCILLWPWCSGSKTIPDGTKRRSTPL